MRKVVQLTSILMRMQPDSEIDIIANLRPQKPVRETQIPREFLLQDLCEKRHYRRRARKLTMFITFLVIYLSALTIDRDITSRSLARRTIATELLATSHAPSGITFAQITDGDSFWDWFGNSLMPTVYSQTTSQGLPRSPSQLYTIATRSTVLGGFHVMQQRYFVVNSSSANKHELCYRSLDQLRDSKCLSTSSYSTDAFGTVSGVNASDDGFRTLGMFQYSVNDDSMGGFQTSFLYSSTKGEAEYAKVKAMQTYQWIDLRTWSVEVTIPAYNLNLMKLVVATLRVEFSLTGGVTTSSVIQVVNVQPYNIEYSRNLIRVVYEALYVLHVMYFIAAEMWNLCIVSGGSLRKYISRLGMLEALGEILTIVVNSLIIAYRWYITMYSTNLREKIVASSSSYVSMIGLTDGDDFFVGLNTFNVLVLTTRSLVYFQVTDGGRRLLHSVYSAMPDILSFLPIYAAVLIGYTFVGNMLYGLTFPEWSTLTKSFYRVFEMNFGLYDPSAIYDAGGVLGMIFIISATIIFCVIMLNVFLAILMSTWDSLTEKEAENVKVREKYRDKMSYRELIGLIFLRESVLNSLIGMVVRLESHDTISRQLFEETWRNEYKNVSNWLRQRILRWYWNNSNDTDTHEASPTTQAQQKANSTREKNGPSMPPPLLHEKSAPNETSQQPGKFLTARVSPSDHCD
uniref:Uncharacterized protein n=1 Tax=Globisporangium ultimum (strain ATCC 200006 / CBS 805.95 / DAOM BR144) TaxID=431595 RepID=K3WKG6_GLOUD